MRKNKFEYSDDEDDKVPTVKRPAKTPPKPKRKYTKKNKSKLTSEAEFKKTLKKFSDQAKSDLQKIRSIKDRATKLKSNTDRLNAISNKINGIKERNNDDDYDALPVQEIIINPVTPVAAPVKRKKKRNVGKAMIRASKARAKAKPKKTPIKKVAKVKFTKTPKKPTTPKKTTTTTSIVRKGTGKAKKVTGPPSKSTEEFRAWLNSKKKNIVKKK